MSAPPARPSSRQRSRSSSSRWCGHACTPARPRRHRPTGARPTCTARAWSRSPDLVPRGSRSSHPPTWPPRSGSATTPPASCSPTPSSWPTGCPRLWDLVLAGEVPVWRARLIARETIDLSVEAALFADRLIAATPTQDRAGAGRAAGPGGPAVLRPRPRPRRRGGSPRQARCLAAARNSGPATTDVTMTLDTPDALLFDQTITRIAATSRSSATPTPSMSAAPTRSGSSPTPNTPWTCSPAARVQRPARTVRRREPLRPPHPRTTWQPTSPQHRCRVHREARRRHHPAAHRLAHPVRRSRHQDHPAPRPRPQLRPGRRPARPTRSDARDRGAARRPLRVPRLPPRLPDLRPRPHHRVPTHGRRRTTGPDPPRKPRTPVPNPPPREDPLRLALQATRRRHLSVDRATGHQYDVTPHAARRA